MSFVSYLLMAFIFQRNNEINFHRKIIKQSLIIIKIRHMHFHDFVVRIILRVIFINSLKIFVVAETFHYKYSIFTFELIICFTLCLFSACKINKHFDSDSDKITIHLHVKLLLTQVRG